MHNVNYLVRLVIIGSLLCCAITLSAQQRDILSITQQLNSAIQAKDFEKAAYYSFVAGKAYWEEKNTEAARKHLTESISFLKKRKPTEQTMEANVLLGKIYFESKDFSNAASHFEKASTLAESFKSRSIMVESAIMHAQCLTQLKRNKKAIEALDRILPAVVQSGSHDQQLVCYELLQHLHNQSGNLKKSEEYKSLHYTLQQAREKELIATQKLLAIEKEAAEEKQEAEQKLNAQTVRLKLAEETIVTKESSLKAVEENLKELELLSEKRKLELDLLNKENELANLRIQDQNSRLENEALVRNSILVVILLGSSLVGVVLINYRKQIKSNKKIDLQNKNIKSSINYAKRIQEAMLPKKEVQQHLLKDSFILFKPRDVVSGDFYWFAKIEEGIRDSNEDLIFAAIDCTGHGVPGAFMSMIGINSLNSIVNRGITETNLILDNLHQEIRNALQQQVTGNNDGMDAAICLYRKEKRVLEFSGAKNPLVYIRNNELFQIKGDIHSIGGSRSKENQTFRKHEILIDQPTMVYLFTDGFRDQFGGEENQKFMGKRFSKLLFDIHHLPLQDQYDILNKTFEEWKGTGDQTDDVLVMGIMLNPGF